MLVLSLTFLSTMCRCLFVGDDLTWCHWSKYEFLALHLETIVIGPSIVDDAAVELPRSCKEEMAYGHGSHITLQCIFVGADLEGYLDGVLHLDGAGVAKPLDLVGARVLLLEQL